MTDSETAETIFEDIVIHDSVKCALSTTGISGTSAPSKDNSHNRYTQKGSFAIFSGPDIMCQAGDKATVVTSKGQTFKGITGKSFSYPSHTETTLTIEVVV